MRHIQYKRTASLRAIATLAIVDSDTGEFQERRLQHREEAEKFYRELAVRGAAVQVGMEASGQVAVWAEAVKRARHEDSRPIFYRANVKPQVIYDGNSGKPVGMTSISETQEKVRDLHPEPLVDAATDFLPPSGESNDELQTAHADDVPIPTIVVE